MRRLLIAVLVSSAASTASAWSDAGHKIIASIAYRQLTLTQQARVVAILKQHPRFEEDFNSKMPAELKTDAEQNEYIFHTAATWPDKARAFRGEDKKKYNHATWHYINIPSFLTPEDRSAMQATVKVNISLEPPAAPQEDMNIVQVIRMARKVIADKTTPDDQKAIVLCWLFHCVGDIHQPLHSSALFSRTLFPTGDRGGNSIKTAQKQNLHALWDGFLGGSAVFRTARNKAIVFVNDKDHVAVGKAAVAKLDERIWLIESHKNCEQFAYDAEVSGHLRANIAEKEAPAITLTERYLKEGGRVSEQRVIEAGYRLGAVLKETK